MGKPHLSIRDQVQLEIQAKWMPRALQLLIPYAEAPRDSNKKSKHAAGLFSTKGLLLAVGVNNGKTNPLVVGYEAFRQGGVHAEAAALLAFEAKNKQPSYADKVLVSIRSTGKQEALLARPCLGCASLIYRKGIRFVWHTDNQGSVVSDRRFL